MKETFYELTSQMASIEEALEETGGELTPELETAWAETAESLTAKVDNYNALLIKLEDWSENLGKEIKRLQGLKKTADNSSKRIKGHVKECMEAFGISRLEGAYCKMTLSTTTATEVDEEALLVPYFWKIQKLQEELPKWLTVELKVSKTDLKEAYKDKEYTPAGVRFVKSTTLRIK
jgi:hypothetical protein